MVGIYIMRVGDIKQNFTRSVLDNITRDVNPIWGYDSDRCSGVKSISNTIHNRLLADIEKDGFVYVLFKPSQCKSSKCRPCAHKNLVGLAVVSNIYEREKNIISGNEENGWTTCTAAGFNSWNYQLDIDKYWDLTKVANRVFHDETIAQYKKICQSSIHNITKDSLLYDHLQMHIRIVIDYIMPMH